MQKNTVGDVLVEDSYKAATNYVRRSMWNIDGWLSLRDAECLLAIARSQASSALSGDILEIGVYRGKTSILLGYLLTAEESLHACDVFEDVIGLLEQNAVEQKVYYAGLARHQFETNYLKYHSSLPRVHAIPSDRLDFLRPESVRLVHIDGSHLFEFVESDITTTLSLLRPGGVIVVDDFRSLHTPGVSAAIWASVAARSIDLVAVTKTKAYLCRASDEVARSIIVQGIASSKALRVQANAVFGSEFQSVSIVGLRRRYSLSATGFVAMARSLYGYVNRIWK